MIRVDIWAILGIETTLDVALIRRAYARQLKLTSPEVNAAGFARLRAAYEEALRRARQGQGFARPPPPKLESAIESAPDTTPAGELTRDAAAKVRADAADRVAGAAEPPAESGGAPSGPPAAVRLRPNEAASEAERAAGANGESERTARARPHLRPNESASDSPPDASRARLVAGGALAVDPETTQLAARFAALQQLKLNIAQPLPAELAMLLAGCLDSPALENVSVRIQFESALARWLWQVRAHPDAPLELVIERLRWREASRIRVQPDIARVLAYRELAAQLEWLTKIHPRVAQALTRPPHWLRLWWLIGINRIDVTLREVWTRCLSAGPLAPAALDSDAMAWWGRYFMRPHLRPELLRIAVILALCGLALGLMGSAGSLTQHFLAPVFGLLAGVAPGALLLALTYGVVDRLPFELKRRRRPKNAQERFGWWPATLVLAVVAALLPASIWSAAVVALLALPLIVWALWTAQELQPQVWIQVAFRRIAYVLFQNLALTMLWLLVARDPAARPDAAMALAAATCALAGTVGQLVLWNNYRQRLRGQLETVLPAALIGWSVLLGAALNYLPDGARWAHLALMLVTLSVLVERTPALSLPVKSQQSRFNIALIGSLLSVSAPRNSQPQVPLLAPGCWLFLGAGVVSMIGCLYIRLKARWQAAPGARKRS